MDNKHLIAMKVLTFLMFTTTTLFCVCDAKDAPQFVGPGSNITVVVGRDATLTCRVRNLKTYKVAWLRVDTQTVLTLGPHVITKNHRVGVARRDGQAWALGVRSARPSDAGQYMCQINTEPMITQTHFLQVVVPPDIVDSGSSGEVMVREGEDVSLQCAAQGTPPPAIAWRREDAALIPVGGDLVSKWTGIWLNMSQVARVLNGAFLCIATNGVPPSVSKRILLHVLCPPSTWAVQKLIGGFVGESVMLQCQIEANPAPAVYWTHVDINRIQNGSKHQASIKSEGYRHTASLRLVDLSRDDIGSYQCHVENALGSAQADITVYTLATTTTTSTSTVATTILQVEVTSLAPYAELEEMDKEREDQNEISENNEYVVVLSQHQMQNLDLAPSS